jgi:hypothetical protein
VIFEFLGPCVLLLYVGLSPSYKDSSLLGCCAVQKCSLRAVLGGLGAEVAGPELFRNAGDF